MAFILLFVCCILMHYYFKSFVVKSLFYITKQVINALTSPYHVMDCFTLQPKFQSFFGPGVTAEIANGEAENVYEVRLIALDPKAASV